MKYMANLIARTIRVLTAQFGLWLFKKSAKKIIRCEDCKHSRACFTDDGELIYECNKITRSGKLLYNHGWYCADREKYDKG